MNCRQAKAEIALWVGQDLPDPSRREHLRRHVAQCPGCRVHFKRLKSTLRLLESTDHEQTYDVGDSLWPALARRIECLENSGAPTSRFNGWLPFVAVTAACALLVVVMEMQPASSPSAPTTPVAREMWASPSFLPPTAQREHRNVFLRTGAGGHPPEFQLIDVQDDLRPESMSTERVPRDRVNSRNP